MLVSMIIMAILIRVVLISVREIRVTMRLWRVQMPWMIKSMVRHHTIMMLNSSKTLLISISMTSLKAMC